MSDDDANGVSAIGVPNWRLGQLTAAKAVANLGARWVPFFLPTLAVAFAASTSQLTAVLGFGEMTGLVIVLVGRQLDRGRELAALTGSMVLVAAASGLALTGRFALFAVGFVLTMLGVALCTVAGHTYLSHRVRFRRRARVLGVFEMSWALALLIGAPTAAALIGWVGWRGPFVAVGIAALAVGTTFVLTGGDPIAPESQAENGPGRRLTTDAWILIAASSAIGTTGLTTVAVVGTWLSEVMDVSTEGIGLVAMAFGAAELIASSSSAVGADRIGPRRATVMSLVVTLAGLAVVVQAGTSLLVGAVGLFVFFVGFEFAIVTSFSVVSEAMPDARGRVLASNTAVATVVRGSGVAASGTLYTAFGIAGPVGVSATTAIIAIVLLTVAGRRAPDPVDS